MLPFAVVEFETSNSVAIIRTSWFLSEEEEQCYWPTGSGTKADKLVWIDAAPSQSWIAYTIRVLGKAATYGIARQKLVRSEVTSDLQTDTDVEEPKRKKRHAAKIFSESEDSEPDCNESDLNSDIRAPSPPLLLATPQLISMPQQHVSTPQRVVSIPQQLGSTPQLVSTTPQQLVSTPQPVSTPEQIISTPERIISTPQRIISTPQRIISTPQRIDSQEYACLMSPSRAGPSNAADYSVTSDLEPFNARVSTPSVVRGASRNVSNSINDSIADTPVSNWRTTYSMLVGIIRAIEDIKETQRIHSNMIQTLMRQGNHRYGDTTVLPEGANFPLESLDGFSAMEEKLVDPVFMNGVVCVLGDVGGRTLDKCVKRMMAFTLRNELAVRFNFLGKNGKEAFGSSRLFEVIYRAIKKNTCTNDNDRSEVERAVAKWLTGGRDCDGNRARRAERQKEQRQARQNPELP